MTPSPPIQLPEMDDVDLKHFPSSPPTYDTLESKGAMNDVDARSSSLSEIDDSGANERSRSIQMEEASDAGDTEAETERLEESPQKARTHQNVVLSASSAGRQNGSTAVSQIVLLTTEPISVNGDTLLQTSDISSLEDSSEDSGASPSRKRKRLAFLQSGRASIETRAQAAGTSLSRTATPRIERLETPLADDEEEEVDGSFESPTNDLDVTHALPTSVQKPLPKGKRKIKKANIDVRQASEQSVSRIGITVETVEPHDSNGEDAEMEGVIDGVELDVTVKIEENAAKKRTAMDALGAIEKCFVNLKEKLYDERIVRCDAELAMLESPTPSHPELLAALEVIDRHRDQKIRYEDILIKYKLEALQRKSIAEKAQAQSQYMLEVQAIRERHLEKLNKEFYQIQRERRSAETSAPDYMYRYNPKRSDQIKRQTAYNKEVSILSGVAKFVGFPAAPDLKPLRQHEIDEDLKAMGITIQPPQAQPAVPRPSVPASSTFSRQRSAADEHFLEQNPWANPQHPAHSQLQRQLSAMSRQESPLITPVPQRRVVDLAGLQGSASTIPDGPSSSMAATPATGDQQAKGAKSNSRVGSNTYLLDMLAKAPDMQTEDRAPLATTSGDHPKEQHGTASTSRHSSQAHSHVKGHPHHLDSANPPALFESTPYLKANTTTSPFEFPTVKAEEPTHSTHQSPLLHHYQTPTPISASATGQVHRLGV